MQKELIQQKHIQQQQKKQQKADTVITTKTIMTQKEKREVEFDKQLRCPRSRKKMKLYSDVDLPSMCDEKIMDKMLKEQNVKTSEEVTQENIESFLQSRQEEFIKMVQGEIKEEEERIRKEEETRKIEEVRRANRKIGVLARCRIEGCYVHFIPYGTTSWNNVSHYGRRSVPKQYQQALNLYENCNSNKCEAVEIYGNRLVALTSSGDVINIEKADYDS